MLSARISLPCGDQTPCQAMAAIVIAWLRLCGSHLSPTPSLPSPLPPSLHPPSLPPFLLSQSHGRRTAAASFRRPDSYAPIGIGPIGASATRRSQWRPPARCRAKSPQICIGESDPLANRARAVRPRMCAGGVPARGRTRHSVESRNSGLIRSPTHLPPTTLPPTSISYSH